MLRTSLIVALCTAASGCGFINTDITNFDLDMPAKSFTIDTAQWQLADQSTFPAIDCSTMAGICSAAIQAACGNEALCFGSCDGSNCEALILVSLFQSVDLVAEKPELQEIENQPLVSVTIESVSYSITENTLNIATPVLTLYVAPSAVMSPGDPQSLAVGTFQPVPAGTTVQDVNMVFTEGGEQALHDFMKDYKTAFNIIVGGQIEVAANDPIPTGLLRASVVVKAHAGL